MSGAKIPCHPDCRHYLCVHARQKERARAVGELMDKIPVSRDPEVEGALQALGTLAGNPGIAPRTARGASFSPAQALMHHTHIIINKLHGGSFITYVTPPDHERIGDPSDGWGFHLLDLTDGRTGPVQIAALGPAGTGPTLESAVVHLLNILFFNDLDKDRAEDEDEKVLRDRIRKAHTLLCESLRSVGLERFAPPAPKFVS